MKDVSDSDSRRSLRRYRYRFACASSIADLSVASKDESTLSNCREAPKFIYAKDK